MPKDRVGTPGSIQYSPAQRKAYRKKKARQNRIWAQKSGEVITRKIGDPKVAPPLPK